MSHEFELHHLVSELVSLLQVSEKADVDAQVDLLNKNRTPYITNQVTTPYMVDIGRCCLAIMEAESVEFKGQLSILDTCASCLASTIP